MLSFAGNLSSDSEAFAIFVSEKYDYKDKKDILSKDTIQKINSFLNLLKVRKITLRACIKLIINGCLFSSSV